MIWVCHIELAQDLRASIGTRFNNLNERVESGTFDNGCEVRDACCDGECEWGYGERRPGIRCARNGDGRGGTYCRYCEVGSNGTLVVSVQGGRIRQYACHNGSFLSR